MEPYKNTNPINEDINKFISKIRKNYYSGKKLTFREWMKKTEEILDEL